MASTSSQRSSAWDSARRGRPWPTAGSPRSVAPPRGRLALPRDPPGRGEAGHRPAWHRLPRRLALLARRRSFSSEGGASRPKARRPPQFQRRHGARPARLARARRTAPLAWGIGRAPQALGHVAGLAGKGRDRANVGLTWGGKGRHPISHPGMILGSYAPKPSSRIISMYCLESKKSEVEMMSYSLLLSHIRQLNLRKPFLR